MPVPRLFTAFDLRGVRFPNRIVISPMQMYLSRDGKGSDWHFQHLAKYVVGGAGCVFTEVLCVEPRGRNTHWDMGLWDDAQVPPLARIAGFLRENGAVPPPRSATAAPRRRASAPSTATALWAEADAARGEPPWTPLGPTTEPAAEGYHRPHALTVAEIAGIVDAFGAAARRVVSDGVEVANDDYEGGRAPVAGAPAGRRQPMSFNAKSVGPPGPAPGRRRRCG